MARPDALSRVVAFDRPRLGDIRGLETVHLQCHIGTDTVSLARLGAHMTGLDFSPSALAGARNLAARAGVEIDFVEADVEHAPAPAAADSTHYGHRGAVLARTSARAGVVTLLRPAAGSCMREGRNAVDPGTTRARTGCWWSVPTSRSPGGVVFHEPRDLR